MSLKIQIQTEGGFRNVEQHLKQQSGKNTLHVKVYSAKSNFSSGHDRRRKEHHDTTHRLLDGQAESGDCFGFRAGSKS